jgi:hypothetical protein
MGSVKWGHNRTIIKSYERALTTFMKSHGDTSPTDRMACTVPLTDIIHNLLSLFITEIIRISSLPMDDHSSLAVTKEVSEGDSSENRPDESAECRALQRAHKDWVALMRQACQLIELLALTKQQMTPPAPSTGAAVAVSPLPSEYLMISREIIASLNDLIRQINSSSTQSPVDVDPPTEEEQQDNPALSQNSQIQSEKRKTVYELAKLVKSYANQMTSNNTKTD